MTLLCFIVAILFIYYVVLSSSSFLFFFAAALAGQMQPCDLCLSIAVLFNSPAHGDSGTSR